MTDRTETTKSNTPSADEELALSTPVTNNPDDEALLTGGTDFEVSDDAISPNLHTGTGSEGEATQSGVDGAGDGYSASGYTESDPAAKSSGDTVDGSENVQTGTESRDDEIYAGDNAEGSSAAPAADDQSVDILDQDAGTTDASSPISARSTDTFTVQEPVSGQTDEPVDEVEPEPEPQPEEPVDEVEPEPEPQPEESVDEVEPEPEPQPEEPIDEVEPEPEPQPEEPVDEVEPEPEPQPEEPVDEVEPEPEPQPEEPIDEVEPEPEPQPEEPVDEVEPEPEQEPQPEEPVDEVEPEPEPQPEEPVDDGNNGHGNDEDGVDESNPGRGGGGPTGENNEQQAEEPVDEVEPEPEPQPEEPVDEVTPPPPAEPRDLGTVTANNANSLPGIKVYTVNLHNEVGTVDKVDGGMGVDEPDDRIGQIEFDPKTGKSEQLVMELDEDATEMTWSVDRLYANEERDGYKGTDETGRYEIFNDGVKVGEGQFVANQGSDNGTYTISHSGGFDKVIFSARDFTNGAQSNEDANKDGLADDGSFNNVDSTGKTLTTGASRTDSSDYVVTSVNFKTTLEQQPQQEKPAAEDPPVVPVEQEPEEPVEDVVPEEPVEEEPAEEQPVDEQPAEEEPVAEEEPAAEEPVEEEPVGEDVPEAGAVVVPEPEPEPEAPAPEPVTVKLTFMGEDAGYHSSVGVYRVGQDGNISDVQIVFRDVSNGVSGMNAGQTSATFNNYVEGDKVGVFIVADGWNQNGGYSSLPAGGSYSFVNSSGEQASASDPSVKLVYTAPSGQTYNIKGDVFHAGNDASDLNPDNINHTKIDTSETGDAAIINFEDLKGGGDLDFNDMALKVEVEGGSVEVGGKEITDPDAVVVEEPEAPAEEAVVAPVEDEAPVEEPAADPEAAEQEAANDEQPAEEQPADDTPDAPVIQGTDNQDMLVGGNDAEEIHGAGGGDMVVGGGGNDTIYGEGGADHLNGDAGDDVIVGGEGADMLNGGDGSDVLFAGDGDYVSGGTGAGWVDTLDVSGIEGAGGSADWTLNLTSGSVVEQGADYITLTQDASGHLTTADGSEIEFEGIERING
ncbi:DUF4114 domain-containing protein [Gimibacter soli]|uniref:DUF4114 domain-containing protein n=1 Tax=Gimibacter soli TaxID=3024400 RepID=A0AAF0BLW6_9PROT|nr:DUF4114 domain-containing protein [Gimibacter soli]WCL54662.1 DUF4114 domain-containing protein [Gimibacter soli]